MRGSVVKRGERRYSLVYRAPDPATGRTKQVWRSGFTTKRAAETALKDIVARVDDGTYTPPTNQTVRDFIEGDWLPSLDALVAGGTMKPTTAAFYRNLARVHVAPNLGGTRLTALTAPQLNQLYGTLLTTGGAKRSGLSPTTVHAVHVTISRALGDAVRWGKLTRNVAAQADAPAPSRAERPVWDASQLRTFMDSVARDRLAPLWDLAMTTGLRRGELAGLRWSDVDLDAGSLRVASTRVTVGYDVVITAPKSRKSARTIGLDPEAVAVLRSHRARQAEERLAAGPAWSDSGLVFVTVTGEGYHPQRLGQIFDRAVKAAGLPRITIHGLRHSYATASLESGVDLKTVSTRLGHSTISVTGDTYAHTLAHMDQAAADRAAAFIRGRTAER